MKSEKRPMRAEAAAYKRPKNILDYIRIWGEMDSLIRSTKKGPALLYWKKHSVPVDVDGEPIRVRSGNRIVKLRYSDVTTNRYWYEKAFERDRQNWQRLYEVFATAFSMR